MRYLIDTNIVITILNNTDSVLSKRLRRCKPSDVGISAITLHELFYGAYKSKRAANNVALIEELQFEILEFTKEDAQESGKIRAALAEKGTPIGPYDVLIAGQAKTRGLTLVTRNINEFSRVAGLRVEDWL